MVNDRILRKKPRKAGPGLTFFNKQGMPISIRNAPNAIRIRKARRARGNGII